MSEFVAGAKVAVFSGSHYNRRIEGPFEIERVYKNGNFILSDDKGHRQQYSKSGVATGERFSSRPVARPFTPDVEKQLKAYIEAVEKTTRVRKIEIRLRAISGDTTAISFDDLATIERILFPPQTESASVEVSP